MANLTREENEFLYYVVELSQTGDPRYAIDLQFVRNFVPALCEPLNFGSKDEERFTVKLDDLARWLAMQSDNLKRLLASYEEGQDYLIKPPSANRSSRRRPKECVWLSRDCTKRLALQSRGKNAEQVRTYFILMEEMYKEWMEHRIHTRARHEPEELLFEKQRSDVWNR